MLTNENAHKFIIYKYTCIMLTNYTAKKIIIYETHVCVCFQITYKIINCTRNTNHT